MTARRFQPYQTTMMDRYPRLFRLVRARLGDGPHLRLLSFGCAGGDEVLSLRRYFPQAAIIGQDISRRAILQARFKLWRAGLAGISLRRADSTADLASDSFDAVFAMAVFRHGKLGRQPWPPSCRPLLAFADFERAIADLARCLRPGGLLVIRYAHFRFADTMTAAGFAVVECDAAPNQAPLYGPDDRLLADSAYGQLVFLKTSPQDSLRFA